LSDEQSKESLKLHEMLGEFIASADKQGGIAEAAKNVILQLKTEASNPTSTVGKLVVIFLSRASSQRDDELYKRLGMLERAQIMQMAHMALKLTEMSDG
jgi:hypothetical protein